MKEYFTVEGVSEGYYEEKRSKFIGRVAFAAGEREAKEFLAKVKKEHYSARHIAYAYVIGEHYDKEKFFDDGEPSGTAGAPIIDAIKKRELTNTVVVVVRYFGGIKLGAAGLTRAYGKAAGDALEKAEKVAMLPFKVVKLSFEYSLLSLIEHYLRTHEIKVNESDYGEKVSFDVLLPIKEAEKIRADLVDITSGKILSKELGQTWGPSSIS
ncbi:MAG: YigZ family protein [Selenomonadaceae bacterium]|nr:YigZ family protein [Selenomonadaceae bacterium]